MRQISLFENQIPDMEPLLKAAMNRAAKRCGLSREQIVDRMVAADKVHLTGKPLPLLVDLLGIAPEGGTVLDPFTGGGTTPLACIETGRRFIGVELSGDYFELAGERIKQANKAAKQED